MSGRRALIVGWGAIARELAPRLAAMGVRVSATRRSAWGVADPAAAALHERGSPADLLPLLQKADVVILTCTLNEFTRGMVNARFIDAMPHGAILINVARGGLMDYDAVLERLQSGALGGLGTDVAWHEPHDPSDALALHPRCVIC